MALKWKQDEQRETNKNLRLKNILKSGQPKFLINSTDNMVPYSLVELRTVILKLNQYELKIQNFVFYYSLFPPFELANLSSESMWTIEIIRLENFRENIFQRHEIV